MTDTDTTIEQQEIQTKLQAMAGDIEKALQNFETETSAEKMQAIQKDIDEANKELDAVVEEATRFEVERGDEIEKTILDELAEEDGEESEQEKTA
ncbi:hypothetical protein KW782_04015 [Candidatus Parcubacteria bacterium]|nr:hypothetical protein [Candidatus Parcubacteria bacterium]